MRATIVLTQHVHDYVAWKKVFDENVEMRRSGGCVASVVYRDPADPTRIVVMNHMTDLEAARKYVQKPELIDAMFLARVVGAPQVQILERIDEQIY